MSEGKSENIDAKPNRLTHPIAILRLLWSDPLWSKVIGLIIFVVLVALTTGAIYIPRSPPTPARLGNANVEQRHYSIPTCESVTLNGHVEPNGAETFVWFEWGETPDLGKVTIKQQFTDATDYYQVLIDLKENTTYFYRAMASNSNGTSVSRVLSFTTAQCSASLNMPAIVDYIAKNKEWIFSGIGVLIISALVLFVRNVLNKSRSRNKPKNSPPVPDTNPVSTSPVLPSSSFHEVNQPQRSKVAAFEPDEKDIEILRYLYRDDVDRLLTYIAEGVHLDRTETRFRLNRLAGHGFVRLPGRARPGRAPQYRLTDKGVAFLLKMDNRI